MTYGVVRAFQVIVNTLLCSPEKAGVGGSTPSLATKSIEVMYLPIIINLSHRLDISPIDSLRYS